MILRRLNLNRNLPFWSLLIWTVSLVLCMGLFTLPLSGEQGLSEMVCSYGNSAPPESMFHSDWVPVSGNRVEIPQGRDLVRIRGTLLPGQSLVIPNFYGSIQMGEERERDASSFSGAAWQLIEGDPQEETPISLTIHAPLQNSLRLMVVEETRFFPVFRFLGGAVGLMLLVLSFVFRRKETGLLFLLVGLWLGVQAWMQSGNANVPMWCFTTLIIFFALIPLAAVLLFGSRFRLRVDKADYLLAYTLVFLICVVYYLFRSLASSLLFCGMLLQIANMFLLLRLGYQDHRIFALPAYFGLMGMLGAYLLLWLSLVYAFSGFALILFALICTVICGGLLRREDALAELPAISQTELPQQAEQEMLCYQNLERELRRLGFSDLQITKIGEKCNTDARHLQRVAEYTRAICISMGFNAVKTQTISDAALLHDIGKLLIPDEILFTTHMLSDDEYEQMRRHTRLGYELLADREDPFCTFAAQVALLHHERMDGQGYLKYTASQIPLPARIVAVADVFDALTAWRSYKKPWDFESAVSYIEENGGDHFDSEVVRDFLQCKSTIYEIYRSYSDLTN